MDNLTDATMLIAELTSKLAELDRKVSVYRLGMAAEFTKHSEELLKTVPEDVAYHVSRAIEESLPNYPSLYPPGSSPSSQSPHPSVLDEIAWRGNKSPPPILPHTSGQPKFPQNHHSPQSPQSIQRERDQEFSGLFVPSYLPLLESVDRPAHLPTPSPGASGSTELDSTDTAGLTQSSRDRRDRERYRPSPLRRTTDTSVDSVASDTSSAKIRKSALRRSSSSSKADSPRDPRRVRFDFEGKEVLPSSSPKSSSDTLTITDSTRPREKSALADDSYTTSVGDVEGEQDNFTAKPKKVSSTQALRALSKEPLDEGTVWTVVNPGTGSEESLEAVKNRITPKLTSPSASSLPSNMTEKMAPDDTQADTICPALTEPKKEVEVEKPAAMMEESEEEKSESDDEPALFMVSKRVYKKKSKGTLLQDHQQSDSYATKLAPSPIPATQSVASTSPATPVPTTTASRALTDAEVPLRAVGNVTGIMGEGATGKAGTGHKNGHPAASSSADDGDEDELFAFDGDEKDGNKAEKYLPETIDEDEEHNDEMVTRPAKSHQAHSDLPSSPPINVPARARPSPEHRIPKKVPPHPESTRQPSTSIGSLGNRSLTPGPVKDQQLLEKVSKLDVEVPFFVGSVNGRSGPDASNVKSYQASLMSPTQASGSFASGSFAERLMWEKSQGILYDSDAEDNKKNDQQNRR